VRMVVDDVVGDGLVYGGGGGVVVGVSSMWRDFLLLSVALDVLDLAIVPARYCFLRVILFSTCFWRPSCRPYL
jgi:hypothetical protein